MDPNAGDVARNPPEGSRRPLPTPLLGWLLIGAGAMLAIIGHFLDPISYVGLEVPGSALYVAALGIVFVVYGLVLAGTPDHPPQQG